MTAGNRISVERLEPETARVTPRRSAQTQPAGLPKPVLAARAALVRLAQRFCWQREDAEDAVQSALLIVAEKSHQLAEAEKLLPWVQSIVVRQCLDLNRRQARERKAKRAAEERQREVSPSGPATKPELSGLLGHLIRRLPDRQQAALVLRHLENMSYEAIAEIMQISPSTVRVQVRNGRETLRQMILAEHPDWAG